MGVWFWFVDCPVSCRCLSVCVFAVKCRESFGFGFVDIVVGWESLAIS